MYLCFIVVFDATSFYGHSEYDVSLASMFGGFESSFFTAYHTILPKAPGFETRAILYEAFHYLNHWWEHYKQLLISVKVVL